ncbi:MAG: hypothetical protein U0796_02795 [Gemmatales bacterium]
MNRFYFWVGIAVLIYLPVMAEWHRSHANDRWHLGPHGIPIPLEGDVPGHHPSGTSMNRLDYMILQSGQAEVVYGGLIVAFVLLLILAIFQVRASLKLKRAAEQMMTSFENYLRETGISTPETDLIKQRVQTVQRRLSWCGRFPHEDN